MKKDFLEIIRCPACRASGEMLQVREQERDKAEIRKGAVICGRCRNTYSIKNGVLDLLYNPDKDVLAEMEGNIKAVEERPKSKDEDLLALPEIAESTDPLHETYGYSVNFYNIMRELKPSPGDIVLDLGSGTTWSANKMAEKGLRCVALDTSLPKFIGLESADVFFAHNGVFYERVRADMKCLPFVDGYFDMVMTNPSLHHSTDLRTTIKEAARVLKAGGRLVIINEPVCSIFFVFGRKSRKSLPSYVYKYNWTENVYSVFEYMKALKANGFNSKIFYPFSINKKLEALKSVKPDMKDKRFKQKIGRLISFLWRIKAFAGFAARYLFWPGMILFGMPILAIARKEEKDDSRTG